MRAFPGPRPRPGGRDRRIAFALSSLALVTLVVVVYVSESSPLALPLVQLTGIVLGVVIAVGPIARRARPTRIWWLVPVAMTFLVGAVILGRSRVTIGPLYVSEVLNILCYLTFGVWLWCLSWHIIRAGTVQVLLDAAAATVGVFLALWTLLGTVGQQRTGWAVVWAIYPALDALALALVVHLAVRISPRATAWRWVVVAVSLQLSLDLTFLVLQLMTREWPPSSFTGLYLFTWWCMAVAATHSTIGQVTARHEQSDAHRPERVRPTMIILAVVPALGALAFPVHTALDGITRSILVAALIVLLFTRLLITMAALTRAEAASRHRALHDPLTGLLNRAGLFEALSERLTRDAETGDCTALLFLDCDDFKHVNDTWGHPAGDSILRAIATGLPRFLRHADLLARHGGDEFVIVATVPDRAGALAVAERASRFFDAPLPVLPGRTHRLSPSIGIAVAAPNETRSPVILVERADTALYEAKGRGRDRAVLFDDELEVRAGYRAAISDALRTAISDGTLTVGFQPLIGGESYDRLVGWEALARWTDPTLGVVPPDLFVPIAEEHGLIDELGEAVLRRACLELARLRRTLRVPGAIVSVNVSATQLTQPCFADIVTDALDTAGLPGEALWLEVTETVLVDTTATVLDTITRIEHAGVRIALDDFGSGTSSFTTLLNLPITCVKLDKSLVDGLPGDPNAPRRWRALLELLTSLGIEQVVAEGVETQEQEDALLAVGCPVVQGWLYGRARTVEAILANPHPSVIAARREAEVASVQSPAPYRRA